MLTEAVNPGQAMVREFRKVQAQQERVFQAELKKAFRDLGDHVARVAEGKGGLLIVESDDPTRREQSRVAAILAGANIPKWVKSKLRPLFENRWKATGSAVVRVLARRDILPSDRDQLLDFLLKTGGKRVGLLDIKGDTKRALFEVIQNGRGQGWGTEKIAREIRRYVPAGRFVHAGPAYRAQLIARTEVMHATRVASMRTYRESPVVKAVVAYDGDGDAECIDRNGRTFSFDAADAEIDATHPNCVLSFGPVVN